MVALWTLDSVLAHVDRMDGKLGETWFCIATPDCVCLYGIDDSGRFVTGVEATSRYDSTVENRILASERIDSIQVHDMDSFTPLTTLAVEAIKSEQSGVGDLDFIFDSPAGSAD